MSGTGSTSVVAMGGGGGEVGYGGYRTPFTAVQWQELEQQAMIYKYLVAGLPIPPDLVMPIRLSLETLSARFFQYPSLGYTSYYGKKFDPEPGRCRRTDGKKWRCAKDAHPDSKYCERHMHRGRNRSRKPVETQTNSQSLSTAISHVSSNGNNGSLQGNGSGSGSVSFQHVPVYSGVSSDGTGFGSNVTKLQMEPTSYWMDNKDFRYIQGNSRNNDEQSFSPEASGSIGSLGLGSSTGSATWRLTPSQVPSSSSFKPKPDSQLMGHPTSQQYASRGFETNDATLSKQHCFFGNEIGSLGSTKHEQNPVHHFFSEWPTTKESWSNLEDHEGSNNNVFSSTQLSIAIPRGTADFPSRSTYSSNDA